MATKDFWINLPVRNISKSRAFYKKLGFLFNPGTGYYDTSACMMAGLNDVVIMLYTQKMFLELLGEEGMCICNQSEMLFSLEVESPAEVDDLARKVFAAGGVVYNQPHEIDGWMYGCGFSDPDGHKWNILFMDTKALDSIEKSFK